MADVSVILLDRVADWLTQSSLAGEDLESVVRGLCERLTAAGLPIKRVHLSFSMLHPRTPAAQSPFVSRLTPLAARARSVRPGLPDR